MTTTHATRGQVWRETYTSTGRGQTHTGTQWRYSVGTWQDGHADSWDDAYRWCVSSVLAARVAVEPPF